MGGFNPNLSKVNLWLVATLPALILSTILNAPCSVKSGFLRRACQWIDATLCSAYNATENL